MSGLLTSREDVLAALGWFFDGPYLDHIDAIDDVTAIVARRHQSK